MAGAKAEDEGGGGGPFQSSMRESLLLPTTLAGTSPIYEYPVNEGGHGKRSPNPFVKSPGSLSEVKLSGELPGDLAWTDASLRGALAMRGELLPFPL